MPSRLSEHDSCDININEMEEDLDYKKLWTQLKRLVSLQYDYTKLTLAEKLTILLSRMVMVAIGLLIGTCVLYQLAAVLVIVLSHSTGNAVVAYLIVVAMLLVLLLLVGVFKTQLIVNPVSRFISKLFYHGNSNS